jgi:catechol 2,3-dioxygenase-like lactoylglutathione lyase family enzyme
MMQAAKDSIDLGIMCGDIHASLHFYHDLLGLTNVGVTEATTGTMHRLRFGTSDVKLIDPTHRPGPGPIGIDQQLGFRSLTCVVTNLDEVIQRLEAEHMAFTRPKTAIRPGPPLPWSKIPMATLSNSSSAVKGSRAISRQMARSRCRRSPVGAWQSPVAFFRSPRRVVSKR